MRSLLLRQAIRSGVDNPASPKFATRPWELGYKAPRDLLRVTAPSRRRECESGAKTRGRPSNSQDGKTNPTTEGGSRPPKATILGHQQLRLLGTKVFERREKKKRGRSNKTLGHEGNLFSQF